MTEEGKAYDEARDRFMQAQGIRVLRFTSEQVEFVLGGTGQSQWTGGVELETGSTLYTMKASSGVIEVTLECVRNVDPSHTITPSFHWLGPVPPEMLECGVLKAFVIEELAKHKHTSGIPPPVAEQRSASELNHVA